MKVDILLKNQTNHPMLFTICLLCLPIILSFHITLKKIFAKNIDAMNTISIICEGQLLSKLHKNENTDISLIT